MRSSLLHDCPKRLFIFYNSFVFFTVGRKSSETKTFSENIIYMFCLHNFSVKSILKKNYLPSYGHTA